MEIPDKRFWKGFFYVPGKQKERLNFSLLNIIEKPEGLMYHVDGFGTSPHGPFTIAGLIDWRGSGRVAFAFGYSSNVRAEFRGWMRCLPMKKSEGKADVFIVGYWFTDSYIKVVKTYLQ
jgi:hypothetical protein